MGFSLDLGLGKLATALREIAGAEGSQKRMRRVEDVVVMLVTHYADSGMDPKPAAIKTVMVAGGHNEWPEGLKKPRKKWLKAAWRTEMPVLLREAERAQDVLGLR